MSLHPHIKQEVLKSLQRYEGRIKHLYLDSVGKVTIGVGHLVSARSSMSPLPMYKLGANGANVVASTQEKQSEYEMIMRQPVGYSASWYKKHTRLFMKDSDIDRLLNEHLEVFHMELCRIYKKSKGYPNDFDKLPHSVQIALFDLIFNLGAHGLTHKFPVLNACLMAGDWARAAQQSHRPQLSMARNQYVMQLFLSVAREEAVQ
ncbi:lysozyme family protein [Noviherbaspirillum aerium]|uniref:hypothetical protein n=1 Tax=Noviherbaspirillum aerium TaxID=2588497 RepID=UPI00124C7F55|nr:hypothetical protein [Noviherbaspirillum aerium]